MDLDVETIVQQSLEKALELMKDKPIYAELILTQLLKAMPDHVEGTHLLGLAKQRLSKYEEAILLLNKSILQNPENADNFNNLAICYAKDDNHEKAIEFLEKAISKKPDHPLYLSNLALQYRHQGNYTKAKQLFEQSLVIQQNSEIWCSLGGLYLDLKDVKSAEHCFRVAIAIDSTCAAAHVDLAFCFLMTKKWEKGFEEYEWRFKHFQEIQPYVEAYKEIMLWKGEPLEGKSILLYGEQGLGDILQFIRYAKYLKERGATVTVHSPGKLQNLLLEVEGVDQTVQCEFKDLSNLLNIKTEFDYHCSLMSLPHLLMNYEISGKPYIKAKYPFKLHKKYKTFNIGLAWAGSSAHPNDKIRSAFLKDFQILSDIPGVTIFNLQMSSSKRVYNKKVIDFSFEAENVHMIDMASEIFDFTDTANVVAGMDLIVSVDTSLVHLAGAMGKPCWMLTPYNPDWRWGIEGDITEWYDSVKLYRQDRPKDWLHVVEKIKKDVVELIDRKEQNSFYSSYNY